MRDVSVKHNRNDGIQLLNCANANIHNASVDSNGNNGILISQGTSEMVLEESYFLDITSSSNAHTLTEPLTVPAVIGVVNTTLIMHERLQLLWQQCFLC